MRYTLTTGDDELPGDSQHDDVPPSRQQCSAARAEDRDAARWLMREHRSAARSAHRVATAFAAAKRREALRRHFRNVEEMYRHADRAFILAYAEVLVREYLVAADRICPGDDDDDDDDDG